MGKKPTNRQHQAASISAMKSTFVATWLRQHGPKLSGKALWQALEYGSERSFQRAAREGRLPVSVYPASSGKGRYALSRDVAEWLWSQLEKKLKGGAP